MGDQKHQIMAKYTAETGYVALNLTIQHVHVPKRMVTRGKNMTDYRWVVRHDNKATFAMSENEHGTKSRKFIDLRHQYVQHMVLHNNYKLTCTILQKTVRNVQETPPANNVQ